MRDESSLLTTRMAAFCTVGNLGIADADETCVRIAGNFGRVWRLDVARANTGTYGICLRHAF